MRVEGTYSFSADLETVWDALQNPDILSGCIPGCQTFEPLGQDTYEVVVKVPVAAITGTYAGKVSVADKVRPDSYRMQVEGRGPGGTVSGEAVISFSINGGETQVKVVGDAQVSGVVARVGQRLMGSVSNMLMNQFFSCVRSKIE